MTIDKNIQQQVILFLKWDEGQYAQFIYDTAIAYLQHFIPDYPQVQHEISKSRIFWNWWEKHWELRDMEWLEGIDGQYASLEHFRDLYENLHDAKTLAAAIYMNGKVLEETYVNMINDITKAQRLTPNAEIENSQASGFRGHFAMQGKGGRA